jgi:hypothetical protein
MQQSGSSIATFILISSRGSSALAWWSGTASLDLTMRMSMPSVASASLSECCSQQLTSAAHTSSFAN